MAKLYFYYAAMNAGKSTTLLQSNHNYYERGMQTLLFTPDFDDRYAKNTIQSRIGLTAEAIPFSRSLDFFAYVKEAKATLGESLKCILIDEAQFLTRSQVEQLTDIADYLNLPVLAYGLRSDFMGNPFEGSQYLLAWAEELTEIKTICHCGRKATMNMRIDDAGRKCESGEQILIGGNDRYVATCRYHYKSGDSMSGDNSDVDMPLAAEKHHYYP